MLNYGFWTGVVNAAQFVLRFGMIVSLIHLLAKPLKPDEIDELVRDELSRVLSVCAPHTIYLFGSAATGEMTNQSDIDLIVLFNRREEASLARKTYFGQKSQRVCPVDILFMTVTEFKSWASKGGVCQVCLEEGKIIYGDSP